MSDKQIDTNLNLFNNPMISAAKKNMSKADLDLYNKIGESMYQNTDFTITDQGQITPCIINEVIYSIEEMLNNGLDPKYLTDDEKQILIETRGNEWYLDFGYTKDDV